MGHDLTASDPHTIQSRRRSRRITSDFTGSTGWHDACTIVTGMSAIERYSCAWCCNIFRLPPGLHDTPCQMPGCDNGILQAVVDTPKQKDDVKPMQAMPTKGTLGDALTTDATDAAWRSAANTAVAAIRAPLLAALSSRLDSRQTKAVGAFLATGEGRALLSVALGMAPLLLPDLASDPRVTRLAREMRVAGMQVVSDMLLNELCGPVIQALTKAVAKLPPPGVTD